MATIPSSLAAGTAILAPDKRFKLAIDLRCPPLITVGNDSPPMAQLQRNIGLAERSA